MSIGLSQLYISFVPLTELSNWKSKCPFSYSVIWDHGVWVSFPRSGASVTGLVAMSYDKSSKSLPLSLLNPCKT